jgi:tetratricopeptide (TPR) repeat protein
MILRFLYVFLLFSALLFSQQGDLNNRFMLGKSYEQAGDLQKAKSIYEDIYKAQPQNHQFFHSLNDIYIRLKEYEQSISLLQERIKSSPNDISMYGQLGISYFLSGNETKAFSTWDEALSTLPKNESYYRVISNYAINVRAFDKAIDYLQRGKKISADPKFLAFDLANLYSITMRYGSAAEEYCFILDADPQQVYNIEGRISSFLDKPDALKSFINAFEKKNPERNLTYAHLLSNLYLENNQYREAFELTKIIDEKQNRQGGELFNFAQKVYNRGNFEFALAAYSYISKSYPSSPLASNVKLGYARTMESVLQKKFIEANETWKPIFIPLPVDRNAYEELIGIYNDVVKIYPHSESAIESNFRIGSIYFQKLDDSKTAEEYLSKIAKDFPLSGFYFAASEQLGRIYTINGELDKAGEMFKGVINSGRASTVQKNSANLNLANLYFYKGEFENAKNTLQPIMDDLRDNSANDALELSFLLNYSFGDSLSLLQVARAELLVIQSKYEEALLIFNETSAKKEAFVIKNYSDFRIAEIETALGNYAKAIEILIEIEKQELNITADRALFFAGRIYEFGLKKYDMAVITYENLLAKYPNSLYLDEAREKIIKLKKIQG